jgi:hypothetical protein
VHSRAQCVSGCVVGELVGRYGGPFRSSLSSSTVAGGPVEGIGGRPAEAVLPMCLSKGSVSGPAEAVLLTVSWITCAGPFVAASLLAASSVVSVTAAAVVVSLMR